MEKTYTLTDLEQICASIDDRRPTVAQYFEHHELRPTGLWAKLLSRRQWPQMSKNDRDWLEWHPTGNLDQPALPIPFTARQLTAFSLGGMGEVLLEVGTDIAILRKDETHAEFGRRFSLTAKEVEAVLAKPEPPELLEVGQLEELGPNAELAREALREMHRLHADCVARFGCTDKGMRDAANWLLAQAAAPIQKPEWGIGSGKKWTAERLESLRTYRAKHGTTKAAEWAGISPSRLRALLPRDEPPPKGYSAFTHRTK